MVSLAFIVFLYALSLALARPISQRIEWFECDNLYTNASSVPILRGTLTVPLDYTDPNSNRTHILDLIKTPAQDGPSNGTIVLSFGGPGVNAFVNFIHMVPQIRE